MISHTMCNIANSLYETLVAARSSKNKDLPDNTGILMGITIDSECFGFESDGNTHHPDWAARERSMMLILITTRHQVFTAFTNAAVVMSERCLPEPMSWKNNSNHDSCWRDSYDSDLLRRACNMADRVWAKCPEEHRPTGYDRLYDMRFGLGMLGKPFQIVEVDIIPDPDQDHYFKRLTGIRFVKDITLKV